MTFHTLLTLTLDCMLWVRNLWFTSDARLDSTWRVFRSSPTGRRSVCHNIRNDDLSIKTFDTNESIVYKGERNLKWSV